MNRETSVPRGQAHTSIRNRPLDETLRSRTVTVEKKRFFIDLKENVNGRYVRITEVSGGRSAIAIPIEGVESVLNAAAQVLAEGREAPVAAVAPQSPDRTGSDH